MPVNEGSLAFYNATSAVDRSIIQRNEKSVTGKEKTLLGRSGYDQILYSSVAPVQARSQGDTKRK